MASDRNRENTQAGVADQDDLAAAAEAAEIERDDNLVNDEAAGADVSVPPSATIDQPGPIPPDGV